MNERINKILLVRGKLLSEIHAMRAMRDEPGFLYRSLDHLLKKGLENQSKSIF